MSLKCEINYFNSMRAWYFIQVDMQLHISTNKYFVF